MEKYKYCPICGGKLVNGFMDGLDRSGCKQCAWINYLNPIPVVAGIVLNKKKEILLVKRKVAPSVGCWALPGGFIELNETPAKAGRRELFEETGVRAKSGRLIGAELQKSRMYGYVLVVGMEFIAKSTKPVPGDDAMDAKYIPIEKLPKIPFKSHCLLIDAYLKLQKRTNPKKYQSKKHQPRRLFAT